MSNIKFKTDIVIGKKISPITCLDKTSTVDVINVNVPAGTVISSDEYNIPDKSILDKYNVEYEIVVSHNSELRS